MTNEKPGSECKTGKKGGIIKQDHVQKLLTIAQYGASAFQCDRERWREAQTKTPENTKVRERAARGGGGS